MDEPTSHERRPGGSVEPLDRTHALKAQLRIPDPPPAQRFELRDPFEEVTYRTHSFDDMVRRADRLGAVRFVAIAPDGKRTTVAKDGGQWHHPTPQSTPPTRSDATAKDGIASASARAAESEPIVAKVDLEAERVAKVARLEAGLHERYLIKRAPLRIGDVFIGQTEYRHRGDTSRIAFTESTFRLSTDTNNPSVARSMVDVAEARQWRALRVSGHDDFKRMVWLEATLRQVKTVGYEPVATDQELLRKERAARQPNRVEPAPQQPDGNRPADHKSARGGGSRKTVLAALEAVLIAKHVPAKQREAIMVAAADNLAERLRKGETHRIKVYDKDAPSQSPTLASAREPQRARERQGPSR